MKLFVLSLFLALLLPPFFYCWFADQFVSAPHWGLSWLFKNTFMKLTGIIVYLEISLQLMPLLIRILPESAQNIFPPDAYAWKGYDGFSNFALMSFLFNFVFIGAIVYAGNFVLRKRKYI